MQMIQVEICMTFLLEEPSLWLHYFNGGGILATAVFHAMFN